VIKVQFISVLTGWSASNGEHRFYGDTATEARRRLRAFLRNQFKPKR
jgi:hypothetical protein